MDDDIKRAGLPASLRDVDPFAVATPPTAHRQSPRPTAVVPAAPAQGASSQQSGVAPAQPEPVPCPCSCGCGNLTDKTYADIESFSAARHLRCASCGAQRHFGDQWLASGAEDKTGLGSEDVTVIGRQTGDEIIIRKPTVDPVEEEWERELTLKLAKERRDTARDRWIASLPALFQKPYDDEPLEKAVQNRLERLRTGGVSTHGTSLICFGPTGSGKTWVAYTYARAAVDADLLWPQEIRIGTEAEIVEPIAAAAPWQVEAKMKELLKPSLKMLVIDDVGATGVYRDQESRWSAFTKIIDWMYANQRALVLTTNLTIGDQGALAGWIGTRPYERLKAMAGKGQVFRDENKRAEMAAIWESEYQRMTAGGGPSD